MFDELPTHQDRARAMRAVLAMLNNDGLAIKFVTLEIHTAEDLDRLFMALVDMFAAFMRHEVQDPERYAEAWIADELRKVQQ